MSQKEERELSFLDKSKIFIIESKDELKKVSWPNKDQLKNSTRAVVVISILSGIFIGLADYLFKILYEYIVIK
jgi:preprotein translocase SecE subunit